MLGDNPAPIEPVANRMSAARKTRLRPRSSLSLPAMGMTMVEASCEPVRVQAATARLVCRESISVERPTATIVLSTEPMNRAGATTANTR